MIQSGNIVKKIDSHAQTRNWFMWKFFPENDFFHSKHVELKLHELKKWEKHIGSISDTYRKTLVILVSWKIECYFWEDSSTKILLEKPWDFVADDEIPWEHRIEVLEDSVLFVIRQNS